MLSSSPPLIPADFPQQSSVQAFTHAPQSPLSCGSGQPLRGNFKNTHVSNHALHIVQCKLTLYDPHQPCVSSVHSDGYSLMGFSNHTHRCLYFLPMTKTDKKKDKTQRQKQTSQDKVALKRLVVTDRL